MNSPDGTTKMHRTISSGDVMEYPMHVPTQDIDLIKEEDIEYRDGRLVKSNGTTRVSLDHAASQNGISPDEARIFTVSGSFSMDLKVCRHIRHATRKRSIIQQKIESESSLEETLMASFDEREYKESLPKRISLLVVISGKREMETLSQACKHLKDDETIIGAIQDTNRTKICKFLA